MKKLFIGIMVVWLLLGCSQKKLNIDDVEKELKSENKTLIYDIKMKDISKELESSVSRFSIFPFSSQKIKNNFKGHYSPEFYKKYNFSFKSKRMDKVDYWALQKDFKSIDIIYTKPIWINQYKQFTNDIFSNLCYAHKLSDEKQKILKNWIKNGGVLWLESGLYSIGNDLDIVPKIPKNIKFLDFNVTKYTFKSINNSKELIYKNINTVKELEDIKLLQINLDKKEQINFILDGTTLISSQIGALVSLNKYYKGKIISLLPFDFTSLHQDGELLRWKLLEILDKNIEVSSLNTVKKDIKKKKILKSIKKEKKLSKKIIQEKTSNITQGQCIQLFSTYSYKDALKDIENSKIFSLSRIEKRGKIYVGRVGMYKYVKDAKKDLLNLKKIYPNAYIRRCTYEGQLK